MRLLLQSWVYARLTPCHVLPLPRLLQCWIKDRSMPCHVLPLPRLLQGWVKDRSMPCHTAFLWMQVLQREHRRVATLPLDPVFQMKLLLLNQPVHILPQLLHRHERSHVRSVWVLVGRVHAHGAMQ